MLSDTDRVEDTSRDKARFDKAQRIGIHETVASIGGSAVLSNLPMVLADDYGPFLLRMGTLPATEEAGSEKWQ